MMARVQVSFSPEEYQRARARAGELGVSFAEYVRRLVADDIGGRRAADARSLFDLGDSGGSDVAQEKDRYLGEAVEGHR
jgi:hypothetical protein